MMRSSASSLSPVPLQGKTLGVSEEEKVHFACWEECELLSHRVHRERSYFPKNNFNNNSHSTCSSRICCSSSRSRVYFPFPWNWACLYHRLSYWVLVEVMLCDFQSQAMKGDAASAWLPLSTLAFRIQLLGRKPRSLIMKWLRWREETPPVLSSDWAPSLQLVLVIVWVSHLGIWSSCPQLSRHIWCHKEQRRAFSIESYRSFSKLNDFIKLCLF